MPAPQAAVSAVLGCLGPSPHLQPAGVACSTRRHNAQTCHQGAAGSPLIQSHTKPRVRNGGHPRGTKVSSDPWGQKQGPHGQANQALMT